LTDVPAHAGGIDDVDLAAPGELGRGFEARSREPALEVLCFDLRPVAVEIVDLEVSIWFFCQSGTSMACRKKNAAPKRMPARPS
jgi:hypothetical protein